MTEQLLTERHHAMTSTSTTAGVTVIVTGRNSYDIEAQINDGFAAHAITHVNGRVIVGRYSKPATAWQNGSVSVTVVGRTARKTGTVWIKVGGTVTIS